MTSAVLTLKSWGDGLGVRLPAAVVRGSSLFRVEHDISFGGDRCERVLGQMGKL